jgi:hypothetical protein
MHRVFMIPLIIACGSAARPVVERADPVAGPRYPVTADVGRLVVDGPAFAELAHRLRADIERELAARDIRDAEGLKDRWFILAMLDALEERWEESVAKVDRVAALEAKSADRAMTGLTIRVWADAITHGGDPEAFRAALERKLSTMPIDVVRGHLSILRTMGRVFSPEVCRKLVDDEIGPHLDHGALSLEQAHALVFQRYAVVRLVPVGAVIDQVLGDHGIQPAQ